MVYSACVAWFSDWVSAYPPPLVDEYDLSTWVEEEMNDALRVFLAHAFHTPRARNDAVMICRALFYEYFLFESGRARLALGPNPAAVPRILAAPQTPQKSARWHSESYNILSGHEFGAVVAGGQATRLGAIMRKCGPAPMEDADEEAPPSQHVFLTPPDGPLSPFKWGWRFEPVARLLFETVYAGGPVDDSLGRLRHTTLPRLGASPDGLITAGPRAGRLVELKCPITRTLNGSIPMEYWIQMQLQAEVCDVEAVEYFEVSFGAGAPRESLGPSGPAAHPPMTALPWFGALRVVAPAADSPPSEYAYEYSPLFPSGAAGVAAAEAWIASGGTTSGTVLETVVWWVRDASQKTVLRNRRWWAAVGEPAYRAYWAEVDAARADGRYATVAKPLFLEMEEDLVGCEDFALAAKTVPQGVVADEEDLGNCVRDVGDEETESVSGWAVDEAESDHEFLGTEDDVDAHTNEASLANDVVVGRAPASSLCAEASVCGVEQSDIPINSESDLLTHPTLEHTS